MFGMIPEGVDELVAIKRLAGMGEKMGEQAVFVAGEGEGVAVVGDGLRGAVMCPQFGRGCGGRYGTASAYGFDARDEFAAAEGFADVVVGAQFQTDDAIDFVVARGEKEDGDVAVRADVAAKCQAVGVGQADVEQDAVDGLIQRG